MTAPYKGWLYIANNNWGGSTRNPLCLGLPHPPHKLARNITNAKKFLSGSIIELELLQEFLVLLNPLGSNTATWSSIQTL